jgi:hemolysin activation/secretion protein
VLLSVVVAAIFSGVLLQYPLEAHGAPDPAPTAPNNSTNQPASPASGFSLLSQAHATGPFSVHGYQFLGDPGLCSHAPASVLERYVGTNVSFGDLINAADAVQSQYQALGYTNVNITMNPEKMTNGIIRLHVFRGRVPQVLISGVRNPVAPVEMSVAGGTNTAAGATNATAGAKADTGPRFTVRAYEVHGDTLLSTQTLMNILAKYTGTNIGIADIIKAGSELQTEYQSRGYPTVKVTIPPQQLTNQIVKIRVFQGRISNVMVVGNRYFSSNNVMRALPSLHADTILVGPVFQAELDRANGNQDRQIYPEIQPGPEPNTTELVMKVKDRLPLHAKIEFNNQSSPGTPDLRINGSAVYNNLWQLEHSIGVQYSFSPEDFKTGDQWSFYDLPLVANYSAFYRLPLAKPEPLENIVLTRPGTFGYSEATRRFQLPAPSGLPELNAYASRSTIDTGLTTVFNANLFNTNGNSLDRQDLQQDITINEDIGGRLTLPLVTTANFQCGISGGLDFKTYDLTTYKTNIFTLTSIIIDYTSDPAHPQTNINRSVDVSGVPTTHNHLQYVPLTLRYDASRRDRFGITTFGLGLTFNPWDSGTEEEREALTGSDRSSGKWVTLTPMLSRDIFIYTNWVLTLRAEGQWASEPLISNERFGVGGVFSVRGYREGEIFGDTGWRVSAEQRTPPHLVGFIGKRTPVTVRGAIFMDYAEAYLLDPNGAPGRVPLWGTGFGGGISVGPHWEARFLFSWPLLSAGTTEAMQPRFNFAISGQF